MVIKTGLKISLGILVTVLGGSGLLEGQQSHSAPVGGTTEAAIQVDGVNRTYRLHVPSRYDGKTKVPAVLVLHGFSGSAKSALAQGRWVAKADQENFIAVALDGLPRRHSRLANFAFNPRAWNSREPLEPFGRGEVDDVGFIKALVDRLLATGMVDHNRIYLTGFSNGGAMTFRAGAELSDRIAAIAPVADGLYVAPKTLKRPVPLLLIWGTDDPINPSQGGSVQRFGQSVTVTSAEKSWKTWGALLNCSSTSKTIYAQNGVTGAALQGCAAQSEALFYSVQGMGHHWPGGKSFIPQGIVGQSSDAINATDLIWKFFSKHPQKNR